MENLSRNPVTIEYQSPDGTAANRIVVGKPELERISIQMLRDPSTMVALPAYYARLKKGYFTGLTASPDLFFDMEAMAEAMDAASGASQERMRRFHREAQNTLLGGGAIFTNAHMAEALEVPDLGDAFRAPPKSEVPALFISGTLDGRTPVGNAEELLPGFPNGVHLIIENAGHSNDLFLSSPKILETMLAFMRGRPLKHTRLRVPPPSFADVRPISLLPPTVGRTYLGEYAHPEGEIWRVISLGTVRTLDRHGKLIAEEMRLQIRYGGNGYSLGTVSETTFFIALPGWEQRDYVFKSDARGEVTHLQYRNTKGDLVKLLKQKPE